MSVNRLCIRNLATTIGGYGGSHHRNDGRIDRGDRNNYGRFRFRNGDYLHDSDGFSSNERGNDHKNAHQINGNSHHDDYTQDNGYFHDHEGDAHHNGTDRVPPRCERRNAGRLGILH